MFEELPTYHSPPMPKVATYDYAFIGHLENEKQAERLAPTAQWSEEPDTFFQQKPAAVFDHWCRSAHDGRIVRGTYIESFIAPQQLDAQHVRQNLRKVKEAAEVARNLHIPISSLGGFTSILLEGEATQLNNSEAQFTTGNTLTTAFIAKALEAAAQLQHIDLASSQLCIVGATGDIGSACLRYFSDKVGKMLLVGRNQKRIGQLQEELRAAATPYETATAAETLVPEADLIIAVTSSTQPLFALGQCKPGAIICDAGYPKNVVEAAHQDRFLFYGGLGKVSAGLGYEPPEMADMYGYPQREIVHGCLLESVLLAFEKLNQSYSSGRGQIQPHHLADLWTKAQKHGIVPAPFYNNLGYYATQVPDNYWQATR